MSKNAKDIKDLYSVAANGAPYSRAPSSAREASTSGGDLSDVMSAINDLHAELDLKENVSDARKTRDDLIDMINRMEHSGGDKGPNVSDKDIAKWNQNCAKTAKQEDEIEKLKNQLASFNPDQLR